MASIEIGNLNKIFDQNHVIHDVDLKVNDGEFIVFVGPSGCGKSTMLRLIAGLEEATSGKIVIDEKNVTDRTAAERELAMVFQSYALYPHMSVYDNIAFPLSVAGIQKSIIAERVKKAAGLLKLDELLERKPKELSGGQRQRVAIGRCLVREPKAFLFDEPLSNLDAALRIRMRVEIARLHRQTGATMIYVTHDQTEAMTLADRIVVFSSGKIEQIGIPLELYNNPANIFVATFIGTPQMNILTVNDATTGNSIKVAGIEMAVKNYDVSNIPTRIGFRPEQLNLSKGKLAGHISGKIEFIEHLGSDIFYHIEIPENDLIVVRQTAEQDVHIGDDVSLITDIEKQILFNSSDKAI